MVQHGIIDTYKSDMLKYARQEDKSRIRECFDSIPKQLARDNKKFQYAVIRKGARSSEYRGSLQWIEDAGIIQRCYNTSITELPLSGNAIADMPLECKARTGNAKSLQTVLKHPEHYHVYHALKVGDYNVGRNGPLLTIPFYMAFLLTEM